MCVVAAFAADITPLLNEEKYHSVYRSISVERRQKADRYRFHKDRCLSVGVEYLLMKAYATMKDGHSAPEINTDINGKPDFSTGSLHFSLSHSGNTVFCVISDCVVGCDAEEIRPFDTRVAERFFAEEETGYLNSISDENIRMSEFIRLWTLKESYVKCIGGGLQIPFRNFCVELLDKPRLRRWTDEEIYGLGDSVSKGYQFAWCLRKTKEENLPAVDVRWLQLV